MKRVYDRYFNEVFSEYFIALRKEKRYTRTDVAKLLNYNLNTFTCYEKGTRDIPISVMRELCKFYGVDFYDTFRYICEESDRREKEANGGKV